MSSGKQMEIFLAQSACMFHKKSKNNFPFEKKKTMTVIVKA